MPLDLLVFLVQSVVFHLNLENSIKKESEQFNQLYNKLVVTSFIRK